MTWLMSSPVKELIAVGGITSSVEGSSAQKMRTPNVLDEKSTSSTDEDPADQPATEEVRNRTVQML
jgi:hypothetical protein